MQNAGLQEVEARTYRQIGWREFSRLRRYGIAELARAGWRMVSLLRRPDIRAWMGSRTRPPLSLTRYLGYGLYVGRKSQSSFAETARVEVHFILSQARALQCENVA